jgi:hypothetical protein
VRIVRGELQSHDHAELDAKLACLHG